VGEARQLFSGRLSSGHKIVLLTITRLVETVVERSLVLLDEPEAHLHPPLLAAFVRALSDLLMKGNGVAIAATHSPVLLQEVPQECAWVIVRNGEDAHAVRPIRETFGEGVGLLTHDVFELEVVESGFYQLIKNEAREALGPEEVAQEFHQRLGSEARLLLHSWFASRNRSND
jgi:ABC-type multidrug transport system ATPase subunit